jgi:hypothetical protein
MNPVGLDPPMIAKISSFFKRYYKLSPPLPSPGSLTKLVVLGDGTPDDYAVFISSHHLNGTENVGIIKPTITGTSIFDLMRPYHLSNPLNTILFALDQESLPVKSICQSFESKAKKANLTFSCADVLHDGRLCIYQCTIASKPFRVIIMVNGLSDMISNIHCIEDHFLKAASILGLFEMPKVMFESKNTWHILTSEIREEIFSKLASSKTLTEKVFPQQIEGLNLLKS